MNIQEYFKLIESETIKVYSIAEEARKKGLDPSLKVEVSVAKTLAQKSVSLVSTLYPQLENCGIPERIIELEKDYGKLDVVVAFKIAEEIAKQKFCRFSTLLQAIEAGVRVGFAYITLGVVSSPIEGFTRLEIKKTRTGKDYFSAYFSGPIRSAGTTASCLVLILIDYLRELFGYEKYDPTEEEVKRYVIENQDYHEKITNLQYLPTKEEIIFLAKNLPIQIDGEPTEKLEVSNYKNLERVSTNYIRGGVCLIFSEGLAQKASKGLRLLNYLKKKGIVCTGFDFLEEYVKLHEKREKGKTEQLPTYLNDIVAGRPVFGHPSRSGAFRFRYGRGRVSGFSAASISPATMEITNKFIAVGTQLKLEKPTKGCAVTVCDSIDGPIVKLYDGSLRKIRTREDARSIYKDVEEIVYLGDLLFPFSDLANRNARLIRPGYVEEIWKLELREKNPELEKNVDPFDVDFEEAIKISYENNIPLHPSYIFYWTQINSDLFFGLLNWLKYSKVDGKLILPYDKVSQDVFKDGKRALELLGIEHTVFIENVIINSTESLSLFANLGIELSFLEREKESFLKDFISMYEDKARKKFLDLKSKFSDESEGYLILELINSFSKFQIKDKAGEFIGARMGRPEKTKLRKLEGSPNVLFPVGNEGGRLRSVQTACEKGLVKGDFPLYYCESCERETIFRRCEVCGKDCKSCFYCPECRAVSFGFCNKHQKAISYSHKLIDISHYFNIAIKNLGLSKEEVPPLVKGVRGTSSENHYPERLEKGILRSLFGLSVNKDGTIRIDATELPIIAFKPKEISVSVEKLKELGYTKDIFGRELIDEEQILEIKPHDIIIPCPSDSYERADVLFTKIANFIDELLVKFYNMKPFYNIKNREDLLGVLTVCMSPHNCAGVVSRIIGFSNTYGLYASPYLHAAMRRDCDGDEASIMLLGDVLLNFSKEFLPGHRGGAQDSPLVLNIKIDAGEVDDQILDFELVYEYPLEMYRAAEQKKHSSEVSVYDVRTALKEGRSVFVNIGFTHNTSNINDGVICSNYRSLETMEEKVKEQMELVEKIRAVDSTETVKLVIERHFMKDLKGNLRKFSMQNFRCVNCNEIMRRPPLSGICPNCKGKIIFTINEGSIKKYLNSALHLVRKYKPSEYIKQNLELTKRQIDLLFGREEEKQEGLEKWI